MRLAPRRAGFTLLELVIVLMILTLMAGVVAPRLAQRQASARDARRLQDLRTVQDAIEQYRLERGVYPPAQQNGGAGGWDVSYDGDFVPELVRTGYLGQVVADPLNDATYHYRYYVYSQGSYACAGYEPFYVLGIKAFETEGARERSQGAFECSGRDWGDEFDFVTGGGASYSD